MKPNRYLLPIGMLLFFALCLVPGAQAQVRSVDSKTVTSSGLTLTELNGAGAMTASFEYVITGSPATVSIVVSGCKQGGSCDSLDTYTSTSNVIRAPSISKAYDSFTIVPSWTGGTSVTITVNTTLLSASGGSSSGGGNVSVTSPVDGSGYVEINCKTGCSSSGGSSLADEGAFTQGTTSFNPIGGLYSSSITPLTSGQAGIAQLTNDRSLFINLYKLAGTSLGAPSNYGTSPGAVAVAGMNAFVTNTPAVSQSGTWNVRTIGNAGGIFDAAQNAAAPANNLNVGGTYNSTLPTITSGNSSAEQLDVKGQQLVDLNYVGGTAVSTGTGASGAGIPRVTISNDSSLAANQSTNINQVAGAATGATNPLYTAIADGTNGPAAVKAASTQAAAADKSLVVQINPNQPNLTTALNVALAANQSVNVAQVGGTAPVLDPCGGNAGSQTVINLTASGQVIAGTSSKQTYICAIDVVTATAQNIALVEGTGTTCATSIAGMAGGSTAATGWNFAANGGLVKGTGGNWVYKTATAADNICLLLSSTGQTSGEIRYVQQ